VLSFVKEIQGTSACAAAPSIPTVREGETTSAAAGAPLVGTVYKALGLSC
jgi:hypothetical protein